VAGKVTVGLALYWPCVTGISTYASMEKGREMEHPTYALAMGYNTIYLYWIQ